MHTDVIIEKIDGLLGLLWHTVQLMLQITECSSPTRLKKIQKGRQKPFHKTYTGWAISNQDIKDN